QLVLGIEPATAPVLRHQVAVRKLGLGVDVAPAHPRVRGGGVEVPPVLLGVFAVVALVAGQPEDALLEDWVPTVPEREGQAEELALVADAAEPVLAPAVGPATGVVMGQVLPRRPAL